MDFFTKSPYAKSMGISLLLHSGLVISFMFAGGILSPAVLPAEAVAVEIEIVPVPVMALPPLPTVFIPPVFTQAIPPSPSSAPVSPTNEIFRQRSTPLPKPLPATAPLAADSTDKTAPFIGNLENFSAVISGDSGESSAVKSESPGTGAGTGGASQGSAPAGNGTKDTGIQVAASCIYGPKPAYPSMARKSRWEGAVVIHALIDSNGTVTSVSVRDGSGYDVLDEAALQTLKQWKFSPATKGGVSIESVRDIRVHFRLDDE